MREEQHISQRKLSEILDMDVAVLSRIENDNKFPKKRIEFIIKELSKVFSIPKEELWREYLSDQIVFLIANSDNYDSILEITKEKLKNTHLKKEGV